MNGHDRPNHIPTGVSERRSERNDMITVPTTDMAEIASSDLAIVPSSAEPPNLPVPDSSSKDALQFVHDRRKLYEEKGLSRRWKMRGIGYL